MGAGVRDAHRVADRAAIGDLLLRYARGVDRRDWELVRSCYAPGAYDDHGGYQGPVEGFLDWVAQRHAAVEQSMHFLAPSLVVFDDGEGDAASVETYVVTLQHVWRGEGLEFVHAGCRYVDRVTRGDDGTWRFALRRLLVEFVRSSAVDGLGVPEGSTPSARDPSDGSYALGLP